MKKVRNFLVLFLMVFCVLLVGSLVLQKQQIRDNIIRLHVVADSDSEEDQTVKLLVRDAVTEEVSAALAQIPDKDQAMEYLSGHLAQLETVANRVLLEQGFSQRAKVTLEAEAFSTRQYDTFALPAGVYDALRVTIGSGQGKNWWCVVFPGLCMPEVGEDFADQAAGAGFSEDLIGTLEQRQGYEVRFFLLDCLGWLENFFFRK